MEIRKVSVVGAGVMGMGISQALAQMGFSVNVTDLSEDIIERNLGKTREILGSRVDRGKMSADEAKEVMSRIRTTAKMQDITDVDLVIEAVIENMEAKKQVFAELDELCPSRTILATNTSIL